MQGDKVLFMKMLLSDSRLEIPGSIPPTAKITKNTYYSLTHVIYYAFYFDVAQGRIKRVSNSLTHVSGRG